MLSVYLHPNYKNSITKFKKFGATNLDTDIKEMIYCFFLKMKKLQILLRKMVFYNACFIYNFYSENLNEPIELSDELMDPICETKDNLRISSINDEIHKYYSMNISKIFSNPVLFWQQNFQEFPKLSKLAFQIYSTTASSAEPERHCSSAGITVTDLRSRLKPENLEKLILLREYLKNKF